MQFNISTNSALIKVAAVINKGTYFEAWAALKLLFCWAKADDSSIAGREIRPGGSVLCSGVWRAAGDTYTPVAPFLSLLVRHQTLRKDKSQQQDLGLCLCGKASTLSGLWSPDRHQNLPSLPSIVHTLGLSSDLALLLDVLIHQQPLPVLQFSVGRP